MKPNLDLTSLPPAALIALGVVLVVEIVLDVIALVSLYRLPKERVTLGSKWVWVAIIVLIGLLGAVLYFAIGRARVAVAEPQPAAGPEHGTTSIADSLYGPADGADSP